MAEDQDYIKDLERIAATEKQRAQNVDADAVAKIGVCGNLKVDLSVSLDQINANNSALAELTKNGGSIDRRKELGRDNAERLTKLTASVRTNGEQCGMTAQDVQKTIDQYAAIIKMYDWAN
jgi:hypothetical protein